MVWDDSIMGGIKDKEDEKMAASKVEAADIQKEEAPLLAMETSTHVTARRKRTKK